MHHFLVSFVITVSFISPLWQHAPLFGHFCHHGVLYQPMVTTCTTFWSFLSPQCPLPAHGDNMHHFLVIFVTAVSSSSPWLQHAPLIGHFCHHDVLYQDNVTTCTTFWSFLSPRYLLPAKFDNMHHFLDILSLRCPLLALGDNMHHFLIIFVSTVSLPAHVDNMHHFLVILSLRCHLPAQGDNMHHFLVIFVTAVSFSNPLWQHAPLFVNFCYLDVLYQPMVTTCTTFWSFLSPRCPLQVHSDNIHHFFDIFIPAVFSSSPWWQHSPLFGYFCHRSVL